MLHCTWLDIESEKEQNQELWTLPELLTTFPPNWHHLFPEICAILFFSSSITNRTRTANCRSKSGQKERRKKSRQRFIEIVLMTVLFFWDCYLWPLSLPLLSQLLSLNGVPNGGKEIKREVMERVHNCNWTHFPSFSWLHSIIFSSAAAVNQIKKYRDKRTHLTGEWVLCTKIYIFGINWLFYPVYLWNHYARAPSSFKTCFNYILNFLFVSSDSFSLSFLIPGNQEETERI